MDLNKLQDHDLTLPEGDPDRIKYQAEIDRIYHSLERGIFTRVGYFDEDSDNIDWKKIYVIAFHFPEANFDWLGGCTMLHDMAVTYAEAWLAKEDECGNDASYSIFEVEINEEKSHAALNAWEHNITPSLYFKVKEEVVNEEYSKIVDILHQTGVNNNPRKCLDILPCEFFVEP